MNAPTERSLDSWSLRPVDHPYVAPENNLSCLAGQLEDGRRIVTSMPICRDGDIVITASGSRYRLGRPHPDYERRFPGAKNRFLASLPQAPP